MNGLARERWYPLVAAIAAAALWVYLGVKTPGADALRDLYATSMSFAAITVGFLATAMSIVVSAPDGPLIRQLASSGYLEDLIRYLKEPFGVGILIAAQCLVGFVLPESLTSHIAFGAVWSGLVAWMLFGLYRMGTIFVKIMAHIGRLSTRKVNPVQSAPLQTDVKDESQF
jgi:hypothetical protein